MTRTILILALVMAPAFAGADPVCPKPLVNGACTATADDWFKYGEDQYNLGNFSKAIDAFQKGYELEPSDVKKAAYLFNIAQSYRQDKNCDKAAFFYKRYLAFRDANPAKPLAPDKRQEVEDRIKELEECAKKPPPPPPPPPKEDPCKLHPETCVVDPCAKDPETCRAPVATAPHVISARAYGGGAKLTTGSLKIPIQATFAALAGYPIRVNDTLGIDAGAAFTFTPVPFEVMNEQGAKVSRSARLMAAVANAGVTYRATSKLGLRLDLGAGILVFSGASASPFTANAAIMNGNALSMFHVRVGASADFAITPNFIATVVPFAFSYSPGKAGLQTRDNGELHKITAITAIDFMVGLGYRM